MTSERKDSILALTRLFFSIGICAIGMTLLLSFSGQKETIKYLRASEAQEDIRDAKADAKAVEERSLILAGQQKLQKRYNKLARTNRNLILYLKTQGYYIPDDLIPGIRSSDDDDDDDNDGDNDERTAPKSDPVPITKPPTKGGGNSDNGDSKSDTSKGGSKGSGNGNKGGSSENGNKDTGADKGDRGKPK